MSGQNKKGGAFGFYFVVGIIILLLTGYTLYAGINYFASKFDEGAQVVSCRFLNEIKFGIKKVSKESLTSGEAICNTIDKHTNEKSFVPRSNYKQDKEGAELEIRDMIKKCWYMWLDGSKSNMFRGYPLSEDCFVCYTFKIRDGINGVTSDSISKSMEEPFYAKDTSDNCAPAGGGRWRTKCEPDEKPVTSKKPQLNSELKCCSKGEANACENQGGTCAQAKPSEGYALYNKWRCPKGNENCYVIKDAQYSYIRYIREFGPKGGDVIFKPPEGQPSDISYVPGEIYAISFVSPAKMFCNPDKSKSECYIKIGSYAIVGVGGLAGAVLLVPASAASAAGTFVLSSTGTILKIAASNAIATLGAYQLGILGNIGQLTVETVTGPILNEVPNYIMVSTLRDAQDPQKMGCAVDYGG